MKWKTLEGGGLGMETIYEHSYVSCKCFCHWNMEQKPLEQCYVYLSDIMTMWYFKSFPGLLILLCTKASKIPTGINKKYFF